MPEKSQRARVCESNFAARKDPYRPRVVLGGMGNFPYLHGMADEEIPENVDLRFLASQNARVLRELAEMRSQTKLLSHEMRDQTNSVSQLRADVSDLQLAMASTRADVAIIKDAVEEVKETASLIEGRFFRLEKQAGFAKA